jgi:hypothetical protein
MPGIASLSHPTLISTTRFGALVRCRWIQRLAGAVIAVLLGPTTGAEVSHDNAARALLEAIPNAPSEHWSFQPVRRPAVPGVRDTARVRNEIDAFVIAKLESQGATLAPAATSGALRRRLYLDLIGLPPTPAEQAGRPDDFVIEHVVDDLLNRTEYGERWARHWLDVVRYADSNGYERDAEKPFVWRYRDYVIESLNRDKPFDRMVIEQLAGDELPDRSVETHIATGFLRLGHWDDEPADPAADRYDQLDDIPGISEPHHRLRALSRP